MSGGQLGDKDGPGLSEPPDHLSVLFDDLVLKGLIPPGRGGAGNRKEVLHSPGDSVEGPLPLSGFDLRLGLLGLFPSPSLQNRDGTKKNRVVPLQPIQVNLGELCGREVSFLQEGGQAVHREERNVFLVARKRATPGLDLEGGPFKGRASVLPPHLLQEGPCAPGIGLEGKGGRLAVPQGNRRRSFLPGGSGPPLLA